MNKIPRVTFRDNSLDTILVGLNQSQVQEGVFNRIVPIIKEAVEKNRKECVVCIVDEFQIIVPKSEYKQVINTLEKYYLSKENFDNCVLLRDLATKIKE